MLNIKVSIQRINKVCYKSTTQLNSKRHLKLNVEKDLCCLTALPGYILMAGFDLLHAKMFHSSKWSI